MEAPDMLAFTARIKALCQLYQAQYSPEVDDAYFRVVHDLEPAAVNKGLDLLESTSKFMPKPVDLRGAALVAGNSAIAQRCPAGAKPFPPRHRVAVKGHGVVVEIGEFGGFAVRDGPKWFIYEWTAASGDGRRELWSGTGPRDA